ncbi:MAG: ATP-binding cassette domain-containing protein, partial [Chitinophagales bacterium]|nr:ATP-binding cassette domain-containing protein [Chitinophagales bacterium]
KTGSGKSTIAELILRTYDIEYGEIKINQHALSKINLEDYRAKIGYTPQDIFLFSDTINNNISFGSEQTSEEKIIEYAKVAHVHNDIQQLTNKYKTIVGERGVMLSGGQKQRISIARSLFRNPEFILLDDCLSAVDAHTEKTILTNLNKTLLNKTVVFITHRIFAIMNFDKILVLDDGKIVEQGKHQELLNLRGIYYDLYQLQQAENVEV